MRSITSLPEAVHSSVRSGIILFDLTKVVEELIFNSLDAGATKVSIAVGVGTCYVKVVDNGSGINRDGLVLLGERYGSFNWLLSKNIEVSKRKFKIEEDKAGGYPIGFLRCNTAMIDATSKLDQLMDMDTTTASIGFRGESLGSISDISVLEIVTKAQGRANGYRKVLKGCKCLYLGIDDNREDIGTTVVVRDLFYNQPVRRKHLQSSPKKVLHAVKECVLKIALVHFNVSFNVVDIESEDELLCTCPSSSPLPLLSSAFGVEVCSSLHELNVSNSILKLSGYISGPCETFSVKAFQYVYINSRIVWKSPIHKLLNQLAARFDCSNMKAKNWSHNVKRSRTHPCPNYILNLSCPRSHYDLTFEPSKTSAEFKESSRILPFIENAITKFWSQKISSGDSPSQAADVLGNGDMWGEGNLLAGEDVSAGYDFARKRCRTVSLQASLDIPSISTPMTEEFSHGFGSRFSCHKSRNDALECEEQSEMGFPYQTDFSFQSSDGFLAQCRAKICEDNDSPLWTPDTHFSSTDHYIMESNFATERSSVPGSRKEDVSRTVDVNLKSGLLTDCFGGVSDVEMVNEDLTKSFMRSCSTRRSRIPDREVIGSDEGFQFQIDGITTKKKWLDGDGRVDIGKVDNNELGIELWHDETEDVWSSHSLTAQDKLSAGSDFLARDSGATLSIAGGYVAGESDLPSSSIAQIHNFGLGTPSFDWSRLSPDHLCRSKCLDMDSINGDGFKGHFKYDRSAYDHFADRESSIDVSSGLASYANSEGNFGKLQDHNLDDVFFSSCYGSLSNETEWLCPDSSGKDDSTMPAASSKHTSSLTSIYGGKDRKDEIRYQEKTYCCQERPRRSHSAPPSYKGKKRFITLNSWSSKEAGKSYRDAIHDASTLQVIRNLKHREESSDVYHVSAKPRSVNHSLHSASLDKMAKQDMSEIQDCGMQMRSQCLDICNRNTEGFTLKESQDPIASGPKWRDSCSQAANGENLHNLHNHDTNILDISSGILHLAGDSLVPESISRNCLDDAKVLAQVDRKFIPVVAGVTLAIIDQHAADERIRLEELRQKVLSGDIKKITYLEAEQELVLPEFGYQLLHNYVEQIQNWGWICNIHGQNSRNLNLLHRQQTVATLLAVPSILGVDLTDADLLEFLQQLADTDGSSAVPPSVIRVLNFKACRGAIMFGDKLLPSECSLIVEELKRTALCFQCAHGRPTIAPLVNLEMLHKQIAKLGSWNGGSDESWHGLRRHELTLERTVQRLTSARGHC